MTLKVKKDRTDDVLKSVRKLTGKETLVGVPSSTAARTPEDGEPEGITNAAIGYIAEFGSPANNIPERPHLVAGVRAVEPQISKIMKSGAVGALSGNPDAANGALHGAGLVAQSSVRRKVTEGPFVALAPSTLAARKRRGRTGEKPLIDTGQYLRSITYVVRAKD